MMPDIWIGTSVGHEFLGVVDEVGPSVQHLQVGDRSWCPSNVYCGSCFSCPCGLYANRHNVNPNARRSRTRRRAGRRGSMTGGGPCRGPADRRLTVLGPLA